MGLAPFGLPDDQPLDSPLDRRLRPPPGDPKSASVSDLDPAWLVVPLSCEWEGLVTSEVTVMSMVKWHRTHAFAPKLDRMQS